MIRNLKALGLALVAVFAMSAIAASGASATDAEFSWDSGTVTLDANGENSQAFAITNGALGFTCDTVTGTVPVSGTSSKEVTTEAITYTDSTKAADTCRGPFGTSPTVEMNGCQYNFKAGTTDKSAPEGHSTGTVDIECPVGKSIVIKAPGCTTTVHTQFNVGDITYKTITVASKEAVTVEARVHDGMTHAPNTIKYTHTGFLCGTGEGNDGTYTGSVIVQGTNNAGALTNVTIT